MYKQLTLDLEFDTIIQNQLQKGNTMTHEHYWDKPNNKKVNLVAECQCGDQLFREGN